RRFERNVDQIGRNRVTRQPVERHVELRLADHPLTRRVHDQRRTLERIVPFVPWQRSERSPEIGRELLCMRECPIHQPNLPCALSPSRPRRPPPRPAPEPPPRPPPPAPMPTPGPRPARQDGCSCRRLPMKPEQSLFVPPRDPSPRTVTQLIAPIRCAMSSTSS